MNNTELLDFTGGMNTVEAPHLLPLNESIELTNVDVKYGSLKSTTELDYSTNAPSEYFIEYKRKLYYYDNFRSNALIDDKLYWANGAETGKILPDGRKLSLGLPTPTVSLVQTISGDVDTGTHKGDFKYTYTFYSSSTGTESAPAPLPGYIAADEQNIALAGFESFPDGVDEYRVYRIGGYLARFTLVATVTDTTYLDSIDDTLIDGRLLQTLRSGPPPSSIDNFVELNGRLFGSVGNKVYFSGLGSPDSWYTDDFFNLPDTVVALGKVPAGLLILGNNYTYVLVGSGPNNFKTKVVSNYLGCKSRKSLVYYNDYVMWLGSNGILTSNGYKVDSITYRKIDSITELSVSSAAMINDVYYLSFRPETVPTDELFPEDDLFPGTPRGVGPKEESAEGLIVLDFKRGNGYSYSYLSFDNLISIGTYNNELHAVTLHGLEYLDCDKVFDCDEVFCKGAYTLANLGGNAKLGFKQLSYISPQLTDGSYSTLKEYDKIRINFIGKFKITVRFSDAFIPVIADIKTNREILNDITLAKEQDGVAIIGIPNSTNKSYSIQFLIEGIGILKSIQYSWNNREIP